MDRLHRIVQQSITGEPPQKGSILESLRRSPLVAVDLDLSRPREDGREIDL